MMLRDYVPLANTLRLPSSARWYVALEDIAQLPALLADPAVTGAPLTVLGEGSNVVLQTDLPGLVLHPQMHGMQIIEWQGSRALVECQAGESWDALVQWTLQQGLAGLENLSLIPGSVGAAPFQNIGAYGVEIAEFLQELEALEISSGKLQTFTAAQCRLAYRHSIFKAELKDRFIITRVTFKLLKKPRLNLNYPALQASLKNTDPEQLTPQRVSEAVCTIRRSKLPDPGEIGNAGSFFWNPIVPAEELARLQKVYPDIIAYPYQNQYKLAAAWLIDKAGWKGYREGDVGVHKDHALVLVNYGAASGAELFNLSERIQRSVTEKFGIELQPEVRII